MRIYLDDNSADRQLVGLLQKGHHQVVLPWDANLVGEPDPKHLVYAIRNHLLLLTEDCRDFMDLHELVLIAGGGHPGILLLYSENDPTRDMSLRGIATAVTKLETSGVSLADQLHVLNHWC